MAERAAWEAAMESGIELTVVISVVALGQLLQPTLNASSGQRGEVPRRVGEDVNECGARVRRRAGCYRRANAGLRGGKRSRETLYLHREGLI